jgi:hypothetical protein
LGEGASLWIWDLSDCGTLVEVNWETGKQWHVILFVRGYSLQQFRRRCGNRLYTIILKWNVHGHCAHLWLHKSETHYVECRSWQTKSY